MKKFLVPILLVFAVLIPAIPTQAADVPNFRRVAGDSVIGGERSNELEGYHFYNYVLQGNNENFEEQYISLLQENGFNLIEHKETEFKNRIDYWVKSYRNEWIFDFRGYGVKFIVFRRYGYGSKFLDGETFSVQVANELTYEEY